MQLHLSLNFLLLTWLSSTIWCVNVPVTNIRSDKGCEILSVICAPSLRRSCPVAQNPVTPWNAITSHQDLCIQMPWWYLIWRRISRAPTVIPHSRPPHAGSWYTSNASYSNSSGGWWAPYSALLTVHPLAIITRSNKEKFKISNQISMNLVYWQTLI